MNEQKLLSLIATTQGITTQAIKSHIHHEEDYPNLPTYLVNNKHAPSMKEAEKLIREAKHASLVKSILGGNPTTTGDFVMMFTDANGFKLDASQKEPMTWEWKAKKNERVLFDEGTLVSELLHLNRNLLNNKFRKGDIEDEVSYFVLQQKLELARLIKEAITDQTRAATVSDDVWLELVSTVLEDTNISFELSKRILQEFMYQVKRRLFGLPVSHHLMPVIYGGQGSGKSQFVAKMISVLSHLSAESNFAEVADNRNASLFQNFIINIDEMGKASHADIETIKSAITRDKFTYRPMGSNTDRTLNQNALFIGSSNKTLGEIIKDPTGNRRFVQLDFKRGSSQPEWDFTNATDFVALWCSIDHKGARPMEGFEDELRAAQTVHHNLSSVGHFLAYVRDSGGCYLHKVNGEAVEEQLSTSALMTKEEFHAIYRAHCEATYVSRALEGPAFIQEMNRELGDECPFDKRKVSTMKWHLKPEFTETPHVRLVQP